VSIYKDFFLLSAGLLAGIYIEKANENSKLKQNYNEIMYKIKPIIRDIKKNILEFLQSNNVNFQTEDIIINLKTSLDVFKVKLDEMNKIENPEDKVTFIKEEVYLVLSSIQKTVKSHKAKFDDTETIERKIEEDESNQKI